MVNIIFDLMGVKINQQIDDACLSSEMPVSDDDDGDYRTIMIPDNNDHDEDEKSTD